ncbi:hypothetical protein D1007_61403 [Hordeum vulgare]|nr:hypothetical protein D1007_61403 [Hordeum vulgare]
MRISLTLCGGRSISKNFVQATELVQCCHQRGAPTILLKLDFTKAGFPAQWYDSVDHILSSSRSVVLLNGVPWRWFSIRCTLRQGDPISPYMFLFVAHILQQLVRQDCVLRYPLLDDARVVLLKYTDDTLIVMWASAARAVGLRLILDEFAVREQNVAVVECATGVFPRSYLGLPLSWEKLCFADFHPFLAKVDKYLVGWVARLLSPVVRLALINVVLDVLPTYALGGVLLPPAVVRDLDGLRRSFLWYVVEQASGPCLVAWERIC